MCWRSQAKSKTTATFPRVPPSFIGKFPGSLAQFDNRPTSPNVFSVVPGAAGTPDTLTVQGTLNGVLAAWKGAVVSMLASQMLYDQMFVIEGALRHCEFDVEPGLMQPTFVLDYPVELSPFAKAHRSEPGVVERWKAFAGGIEIANSFSELNDPEDQAARFQAQASAKDAGDEEAMY